MQIIAAILLGALSFHADEKVTSLLHAQTQEMMDAVASGGANVWDRYLDEGAVITTEAGEVQTKAEMIKDIRPLPEGVSGKIAVIEFRATDHGNVAVTNYISDEHENYHGHELHCRYRSTDTWIRTPKGWRLIASQVLAERGDPPAVAMTEAQADTYTGRYALTPAIAYEIRRNGKQLEGRKGTGPWEPLMAEAPDVLFVPGKPRYRKVFLRDDTRKITGFADRREEWDLVWKRME
jgi:hypothetical protein